MRDKRRVCNGQGPSRKALCFVLFCSSIGLLVCIEMGSPAAQAGLAPTL